MRTIGLRMAPTGKHPTRGAFGLGNTPLAPGIDRSSRIRVAVRAVMQAGCMTTSAHLLAMLASLALAACHPAAQDPAVTQPQPPAAALAAQGPASAARPLPFAVTVTGHGP